MTKIRINTLILSFLLLSLLLGRFTAPVFSVDLGKIEPIPGSIGDTTQYDGNSGTALEVIVSTIIGFLTVLSGLYFLIYFLLGAMSWITAGEDKTKLENARNKMTNAAIGLTIVVASFSIFYIVGKILGIDFLNLGTLIMDYLSPTGTAPVNG